MGEHFFFDENAILSAYDVDNGTASPKNEYIHLSIPMYKKGPHQCGSNQQWMVCPPTRYCRHSLISHFHLWRVARQRRGFSMSLPFKFDFRWCISCYHKRKITKLFSNTYTHKIEKKMNDFDFVWEHRTNVEMWQMEKKTTKWQQQQKAHDGLNQMNITTTEM